MKAILNRLLTLASLNQFSKSSIHKTSEIDNHRENSSKAKFIEWKKSKIQFRLFNDAGSQTNRPGVTTVEIKLHFLPRIALIFQILVLFYTFSVRLSEFNGSKRVHTTSSESTLVCLRLYLIAWRFQLHFQLKRLQNLMLYWAYNVLWAHNVC